MTSKRQATAVSSGDWVAGENFAFVNSPQVKKISLGGGSVRSPINTRRRTLYGLGSQALVSRAPESESKKAQSVHEEKTQSKRVTSTKTSKVKKSSTSIKQHTSTKKSLSEISEVPSTDHEVAVKNKAVKKVQNKVSSPPKRATSTIESTSQRKSMLTSTEKKSADAIATKNPKWKQALPAHANLSSVKPVEVVLESMIAEAARETAQQKVSSSPKCSPVKVVEKSFTAIKPATSKVNVSPANHTVDKKPRKSDWMSNLPSNAVLPVDNPASVPVTKTPNPIKKTQSPISAKSSKMSKSTSKPSVSSVRSGIGKSTTKAKSVRKTRLSVATHLSSPPSLEMSSESLSTIAVAQSGSPVLMQSKAISAKPKRPVGRPPNSAKKAQLSCSPKEAMKMVQRSLETSPKHLSRESQPMSINVSASPSKMSRKPTSKSMETSTTDLMNDSASVRTPTLVESKIASAKPKRPVGRPPKSAKKVAPNQPAKLQSNTEMSPKPSTSKVKQHGEVWLSPVKNTVSSRLSRKSTSTLEKRPTTDVMNESTSVSTPIQSTRKRKSMSALADSTIPAKTARLRLTPARLSAMYMTPTRDLQQHTELSFATPNAKPEIQSTAGHTPYKNPLVTASAQRQTTPARNRKPPAADTENYYDTEVYEENTDVSVMEEHPIEAAATSGSWWCSIM